MKNGHRIYLKQMLLTEQGEPLLPPWAFFLRCIINTNSLRPTASRENFYEDEDLDAAQKEFAHAVRSHLESLTRQAPERIEQIVQIHVQAIKSMAVWDDDLFRLFIDYLPFVTSEGTMTGAALKKAGEALWVSSVPKFQQLKPIFMAQGRLLICTGYTFDHELIGKLARVYELPISQLQEEGIDMVMEELTVSERLRTNAFLAAADRGLAEFDCMAQVRRFLPVNLPALYVISDEVKFLREIHKAQETSYGVFTSALTSLLGGIDDQPMATLYFNLNSPLVERLTHMEDGEMQESMACVLYVQALLAGGHPLRGGEMKAMNRELLHLIDHSIL